MSPKLVSTDQDDTGKTFYEAKNITWSFLLHNTVVE